MKKTIAILTMLLVRFTLVFAGNQTDSIATQKGYFQQAKTEIEEMLSGTKPIDYERAVFITENAYLGNTINYELYQGIISFHATNIKRLAEANRKPQVFKATLLETEAQQRDNYEKLLYNWAIYNYFTDTTAIMYNEVGKNSIYFHLPYAYPSSDPMASIDWSNSQTMNLLNDKAANCNAQVALYKILSDRLNTDAKIGTAPSHAYITHTDTRGTTYNVELPTRSFPGAGAIMTVTYTPVDAVRSGIAMRSLTPSQSVALCLVYLAKGYEHKFGKSDNSFTMNCSETALRYDSLCLNAMLLKAEILEEKISAKHRTALQLQTDKDFVTYQKTVSTLYKKGYREMPLDMKNLIVSNLKQDSANFFLQNHTPRAFQTINPKDSRYATLSWGKYDEVHEPKRFEQYGRAIFDTKTMKISKLITADSLYNNYPFDPVIAAWQVDPLASKYPSISPYAAFANNPIIFIDSDGREVKPMSNEAFEIIRLGLSPEESNYLKLDENGNIDKNYMQLGANELNNVGKNFTSLLKLVNDKQVVEVYVQNTFETSTGMKEMGQPNNESDLEASFAIFGNGMSKEEYAKQNPNLSTNEVWSGWFGVTLYPDEQVGNGTTTNGNIQIYINSNTQNVNSKNGLKKMVSTFAHEAYGHTLFKLLNLWHSHGRSMDPNSADYNKNLEKQIKESTDEAESNYDEQCD